SPFNQGLRRKWTGSLLFLLLQDPGPWLPGRLDCSWQVQGKGGAVEGALKYRYRLTDPTRHCRIPHQRWLRSSPAEASPGLRPSDGPTPGRGCPLFPGRDKGQPSRGWIYPLGGAAGGVRQFQTLRGGLAGGDRHRPRHDLHPGGPVQEQLPSQRRLLVGTDGAGRGDVGKLGGGNGNIRRDTAVHFVKTKKNSPREPGGCFRLLRPSSYGATTYQTPPIPCP